MKFCMSRVLLLVSMIALAGCSVNPSKPIDSEPVEKEHRYSVISGLDGTQSNDLHVVSVNGQIALHDNLLLPKGSHHFTVRFYPKKQGVMIYRFYSDLDSGHCYQLIKEFDSYRLQKTADQSSCRTLIKKKKRLYRFS